MRPLTEVVAKPAVPLLDVPLGAWGLAALADFRPTIVNVSHLRDTVVDALGTTKDVGFFTEKPEPFGTGGTLAALRERVADTFICWNSDMLTDLDAQALWHAHRHSRKAATIAVRPTEDGADFLIEGDDATALIDRRTTDRAGVQYMGAAVFDQEVLELLPDTRPLGLTLALLKPLIENNRLGVHVHDGYWIDVGTIDRYLQASLDIFNEVAPPPPVKPAPARFSNVAGGRAYVGPNANGGHEIRWGRERSSSRVQPLVPTQACRTQLSG